VKFSDRDSLLENRAGFGLGLSDIIVRAGAPAGMFNLIMGHGSVIGEAIVSDRNIDAVRFTGSVAAGQKILATVAARGVRIDDARKTGTTIGPVVDAQKLKQDLDYIQIGQAEGGRLVTGGQTLTGANQRINQKEIFGPVASVIRVANYEEALATANGTPFGLCVGICTASLKLARHFQRNAEAGMVMVNLPTAGVDYHVPFGGRKAPSYGPREQGQAAMEFYTVTKTSYIKSA
jgi:acyl-CoA reductase-like NAD-dependent aldehyde dehydrogenase